AATTGRDGSGSRPARRPPTSPGGLRARVPRGRRRRAGLAAGSRDRWRRRRRRACGPTYGEVRRHASPLLDLQVEGEGEGTGERRFLARKQLADLATERVGGDGGDVVAAHHALVVEPVRGAEAELGGQAADRR